MNLAQQPGFQPRELYPKAWVSGSGSGGQLCARKDTSIRAKEKRDKGQAVEEERRDHGKKRGPGLQPSSLRLRSWGADSLSISGGDFMAF